MKFEMKEGDRYFSIAGDLSVVEMEYRDNDFDRRLIEAGNCFCTRFVAEMMAEKVKVLFLCLEEDSDVRCETCMWFRENLSMGRTYCYLKMREMKHGECCLDYKKSNKKIGFKYGDNESKKM